MPIATENRGRYPDPETWAAIRHLVLVRAGFRCECDGRCGRQHRGRCVEQHMAPARTGGAGVRIVLTTAHLDHTPENNALENLAAMCQGCHLHYDIDHHVQSMRERRLQALEAAGQLPLAGIAPLPAPPSPARVVPTLAVEAAGVGTRRDELERLYSVRALPDEVLERLAVAIVVDEQLDEMRAVARAEIAAACAEALDAGAQVNELAQAVAGSKPRLYRLLAEHRTHQEARHAA